MDVHYVHDPLGNAMWQYQQGKADPEVTVLSTVAETEPLPVSYFFRAYAAMPALEQSALAACRGRVLDLGAGAGAHALHLQQQGFQVTAVDQSPGAVEVMRARGIRQCLHAPWHALPDERYDTVLMLMNGLGLVGNLAGLEQFFERLPQWLKPGGQLLADSSDLVYLGDPDGAVERGAYPGEIQFQLQHDGMTSGWFPWLFIGPELLTEIAGRAGFHCEVIAQGPNHDFLASITLR